MDKINKAMNMDKGPDSRRPEPSVHLKCDICGKQFNNSAIMKYHKTTMHKAEKENQDSRKCDICNKQFNNTAYLKVHKEIIHRTNQEKLKCEVCGKEFNNRAIMRDHKTRMHKTDQEKRAIKPNNSESDPESSNAKSPKNKHESVTSPKHTENRKTHNTSKCDICDKQFNNKAYLIVHKERIHKINQEKRATRHKGDECESESSDTKSLKNHELNHKK